MRQPAGWSPKVSRCETWPTSSASVPAGSPSRPPLSAQRLNSALGAVEAGIAPGAVRWCGGLVLLVGVSQRHEEPAGREEPAAGLIWTGDLECDEASGQRGEDPGAGHGLRESLGWYAPQGAGGEDGVIRGVGAYPCAPLPVTTGGCSRGGALELFGELVGGAAGTNDVDLGVAGELSEQGADVAAEQEPAVRTDHSQTARMSDRCGLVRMCHSR
jgi:hypothetical protein